MDDAIKSFRSVKQSFGNVGDDPTIYTGFSLGVGPSAFGPSGTLAELVISGVLAANSNDKRIQLIAPYFVPGDVEFFDSEANLNGLSGLNFSLVVSFKGDGFPRMEFLTSDLSYTAQSRLYLPGGLPPVNYLKIILTGEATDDIKINSLDAWILGVPYDSRVIVPPGPSF